MGKATARRETALAGEAVFRRPASNPLMRRIAACLCAAAFGLISGCAGGKERPPYTVHIQGGSAERGRAVMIQFRCGSCHMIPGVPGAHGQFGPPLMWMARRTYIAGEFPNIPENLVRWVQSPTSMKPKTAMPDLGLTQQQATDVAAYLQTLR